MLSFGVGTNLFRRGRSARGVQRRLPAQEIRLPGQEDAVEVARLAGDLGEQGAVGDQRRVDPELRRDAVAVGLFWTIQVGAVVVGHIVGAWAGHIAARLTGGRAAERRAQVALAVLMVALTTITLWSLGQALVFDAGTPAG